MQPTTQDSNPPTRFVTLKSLADTLAADRSTVRRWLRDAGVEAIAMGDGPRSAIRYRLSDIESWLKSRPSV